MRNTTFNILLFVVFIFSGMNAQGSFSQKQQDQQNQDEREQARKEAVEEKIVDLKEDIITIQEKDVLDEKMKELGKLMEEKRSNTGYQTKTKRVSDGYTGNTPPDNKPAEISDKEKQILERNKTTNKNYDLIRKTTEARKKALKATSSQANLEIKKSETKLQKLSAKVESDFKAGKFDENIYKKKLALLKTIKENILLLKEKNESAVKLLDVQN